MYRYGKQQTKGVIMDLQSELMRIAEKTKDTKDREILYSAAFKLVSLKPSYQKVTNVPGYGCAITSEYK